MLSNNIIYLFSFLFVITIDKSEQEINIFIKKYKKYKKYTFYVCYLNKCNNHIKGFRSKMSKMY